jgi:hypothetical protein
MMIHVLRRKGMTRLTGLILSTLLLPELASAKRLPSPKVDPVVYESVRYVAPNDDGRRGLLILLIQSDKETARQQTLRNVQWVFIKTLNIQNGKLMVTSERGKTYKVDVNTKKITQSDSRSCHRREPLVMCPTQSKRP